MEILKGLIAVATVLLGVLGVNVMNSWARYTHAGKMTKEVSTVFFTGFTSLLWFIR